MRIVILILKKVIYVLAAPFSYLESGTFTQRLEAAVVLGTASSPVVWFSFHDMMEKYLLNDRGFVQTILVLLAVDLVSGMLKHLKLHDFSWKELQLGLLEKVFVSMCGVVLFNVFGSINGLENNDTLLTYFLLGGKLINATYVGGSAFNNLFIISGGRFPPLGFIKRMKDFNLSGDVDDLTKKAEVKSDTPVTETTDK